MLLFDIMRMMMKLISIRDFISYSGVVIFKYVILLFWYYLTNQFGIFVMTVF